MNIAKNILPAVYSGMNKVVKNGGDTPHDPLLNASAYNGGDTPVSYTSHDPLLNASTYKGGVGGIPHRDKKLLNLQAEAEQKKKQIKEDYRELKSQIKENPHLQEALIHYEEYFALQEKQIKALKHLLNDSFLKKEDQQQIKREIANLEKNLA